jgi:hypothetical protein
MNLTKMVLFFDRVLCISSYLLHRCGLHIFAPPFFRLYEFLRVEAS